MKTNLFIIILMLLPIGRIMAQSRIWEMPTIPADTTIVREWKDGKYIVYARNGTNQTVSFHDNLSPFVRSAQIPSMVIVNDIRIVGDMVYAGGKIMGSPFPHGLLACFDINDLMGAGGAFHTMTVFGENLNNSNCQTQAYCHVTGIKRIAPFQDGQKTVVPYIADDTILNGSGNGPGCRRVGYGDAVFSGSAWIPDTFHYNKDAFNLFSDFAVTDNHIVLVSKNCDLDRLEFVIHDKRANYASPLPIPGWDIYYFSDHKVLGRVMATPLSNDDFAVAYHYEVPSMGAGVAVKVIRLNSAGPSLLYSLEIPPATSASNWSEMKDIRYDRISDELWLLNDIDNPVTGSGESYLYRIDMANVFASLYETRYIPRRKLQSMDVLATGGYLVSGSHSGILNVLVEQAPAAPFHCTDNQFVRGVKTAPTIYLYGRHHCSFIPTSPIADWPFTVDESPAEKPCEY